jgi:hypothetical protein
MSRGIAQTERYQEHCWLFVRMTVMEGAAPAGRDNNSVKNNLDNKNL